MKFKYGGKLGLKKDNNINFSGVPKNNNYFSLFEVTD